MPRYRVSWTEMHSAWVEAQSEHEAVEEALSFASKSCDSQSLIEVRKPEQDDMDASKASSID